MNKYIESLSKVHNNVFVLTPLFIAFYKNVEPKPNNILLSYLVLPLVLYKVSQNKIRRSNARSNIYTFLNSKEKSKRANVYGLPERVQEYKNITNQCLQYAIDNNWLQINEDLSVNVLEEQNNKSNNLEVAFKASQKLYNIFKDLEVIEIYRLLGVKKL